METYNSRPIRRKHIDDHLKLRGKGTFKVQNISFIGLGAMGTPMPLNYKKYNLFLYDINTKNYKKFYKSKAKICNNYKDLSSKSDVFISMLPDVNFIKFSFRKMVLLILLKKFYIYWLFIGWLWTTLKISCFTKKVLNL